MSSILKLAAIVDYFAQSRGRGNTTAILKGAENVPRCKILVDCVKSMYDSVPVEMHDRTLILDDLLAPNKLKGSTDPLVIDNKALEVLGFEVMTDLALAEKEVRAGRIKIKELTEQNEVLSGTLFKGYEYFDKLSNKVFNVREDKPNYSSWDINAIFIYVCGALTIIGFVSSYVRLLDVARDLNVFEFGSSLICTLATFIFAVYGFFSRVKDSNLKASIIDSRYEINKDNDKKSLGQGKYYTKIDPSS